MTYKVEVSIDLQEIVPGFIENRKKDLVSLRDHISNNNLHEIEKIGHKVAGSSGGYGFHELGELARSIEKSAVSGDIKKIGEYLKEFESLITDVEIVFIDDEA